MRTPEHAATVVRSMTKALKIPVTVKMRAGWNDEEINAPLLARMVEDAGASAVTVHGRTAAQAYTGSSDWSLIGDVARSVTIPVLGSGDCVDAGQLIDLIETAGVSGVLVGRGVLRNPWIFQAGGRSLARRRGARGDAGRTGAVFCSTTWSSSSPSGWGRQRDSDTRRRRRAPHQVTDERTAVVARGRERWVVNKLRALGSWYTKGLDNGSRLRVAINAAESAQHLRDVIREFFDAPDLMAAG